MSKHVNKPIDGKNVYDKIRDGDYQSKLVLRDDRVAYNKDQARLEKEFEKDALEYVGLTGHPKADKVYSLAWQHGHSMGYSDVMNYLLDFADLVKD